MKRLPVYKEDKPHIGFLNYVRNWLKSRDLKPECLLVSKPNLVIAVLKNYAGQSIICFYIQKLDALGTGGVVIYYDLQAMGTRLKTNVENTFTNWISQNHVNDL